MIVVTTVLAIAGGTRLCAHIAVGTAAAARRGDLETVQTLRVSAEWVSAMMHLNTAASLAYAGTALAYGIARPTIHSTMWLQYTFCVLWLFALPIVGFLVFAATHDGHQKSAHLDHVSRYRSGCTSSSSSSYHDPDTVQVHYIPYDAANPSATNAAISHPAPRRPSFAPLASPTAAHAPAAAPFALPSAAMTPPPYPPLQVLPYAAPGGGAAHYHPNAHRARPHHLAHTSPSWAAFADAGSLTRVPAWSATGDWAAADSGRSVAAAAPTRYF
ncbi:hypothetical protein DFJ73DRAFT_784867 [Zopfochytrium polystomum]|nr:hypothetical protein DFJ73DRAFT_784867 [Zopfochytrium polystomum]